MITYADRGTELLERAIRSVEDVDELAKLRALVWEFHAGNALVFGDLMAQIEARASALLARREQAELFAE